MKLLGIDNVFFQVGNLDIAIEFFEKLGFKLKFRIPRISSALLEIGGEVPGLMLRESKDPRPSKMWIEVSDALDAKKTVPEGTLLQTATGITYEISDPWGNIIGFADYSKRPELSRAKGNLN